MADMIALRFAATALCLAPAAGCSQNQPYASTPVRLTPVSNPYFGDIPVPLGFSIVDGLSMDITSGGLRQVRHVYEGSARRVHVRDFYVEQMPIARWRLVNSQFEQGVYTLRYEKERESCEVRIGESGSLSRKCQIRVLVAPRQTVEPPPGKKSS